MIRVKSTDYGASLYTRNGAPDFEALASAGRIRKVFDRDDWSAGDYTYSESDLALFLTGTGEMLWQWVPTISPWECMDRIGVLEVLSLLAHDYGLYGVFGRLHSDLKLRVADSKQFFEGLEEWQQELYTALEPRAELTSPTARYLARKPH